MQLTTTLEATFAYYSKTLTARNRSVATITAYRTEMTLLVTWLHKTNVAIAASADVAGLGRRLGPRRSVPPPVDGSKIVSPVY